jgi:hypothetical protein
MGGFVDSAFDFVSDISGFDVGGVVPGLTGQLGAEAAQNGARLQYDATLRGIESQEASEARQLQNLSPFRNLAPQSILDTYRNYATNIPSYSYNPANDSLLQDAASVASKNVLNMQAAQGKAGAGGTQLAINQALAPIYMQRQNQMFTQQFDARNQGFNQMNQLVSNAQNAAAGQGAAIASAANNITDLYGQGGNAMAAGGIGAANAYSQGGANVAGIGGMIAGLFACDVRLKENITPMYVDADGLTVSEFNYIGNDDKYLGKMAQDIAQIDPENVVKNENGYLLVTAKYAPQRIS